MITILAIEHLRCLKPCVVCPALFKSTFAAKKTNKSSFFIARCYMRKEKEGRCNNCCFMNCVSYYNNPVNFSYKIISYTHYRKSYYKNNN